MSEFKILKPTVPGENNLIPGTMEKLPDEGKAIRMTTFWYRRLLDGSVVEVGVTPAFLPAPEAPNAPEGEE